jgi:hypothetical protein
MGSGRLPTSVSPSKGSDTPSHLVLEALVLMSCLDWAVAQQFS